jgi:hypothetical protein
VALAVLAVEAAEQPGLRLLVAQEVAAERRVPGVAVVATAVLLVPKIRGATEATAIMDMAAQQEPMAAQLAEAFTIILIALIGTRSGHTIV